MQPFDKIKQYSMTVCEQIRWKKARSLVAQEIEDHICDQRDIYIEKGFTEDNATDKAVAQMGDAVSIGLELDKTHKPRPQWCMAALTGILLLIGMLSQYFISTSMNLTEAFHILPFVLAFAIFAVCYYADFTLLGKYAFPFYLIVLICSLAGIFFGRGVNGRLCWISFGISINLSYLALIFPLAFALLVYILRNKGYWGILLSGIGYLPFALILCYVPTLSGLLLYTMTALTVLCYAVIKGWFGVHKKKGLSLILIPAFLAGILLMLPLIRGHHFTNRLNAILHPYSDRSGAGYIPSLIRDVLTSSSFVGKGSLSSQFVESIAQDPLPSSDYMLTTLIHTFGWITLIGIIAALALFSCIGFYHTAKEKSVLGSLMSLSIMLTFTLQCISYILDNLAFGLVSALSLPFISYGSTALLINAALVGFMLSIFRTGSAFKDESRSAECSSLSFLTYKDGKLIINLRG